MYSAVIYSTSTGVAGESQIWQPGERGVAGTGGWVLSRIVCMQIGPRLHELYIEKTVLIFPRIAFIRLLNKHTHTEHTTRIHSMDGEIRGIDDDDDDDV